eukprot:4642563-Pyramimonas_sp.AAC.2
MSASQARVGAIRNPCWVRQVHPSNSPPATHRAADPSCELRFRVLTNWGTIVTLLAFEVGHALNPAELIGKMPMFRMRLHVYSNVLLIIKVDNDYTGFDK